MPQDRAWQGALRMAGTGTEFGVTFAMFVLAGVWLDRRCGWRFPVCTLLGAAAGFALAMYRLVQQARRYQRKDQSPPDGRQ